MQPDATAAGPLPHSTVPGLSWLGIVRLGLVQTAIGAIFVLATSTLNRVMVVELALPAVLPGLLIALHYATQVLRPALGYGSDRGGRRTPWIIGGMAILACGCLLAATATALMTRQLGLGIALAAPAFLMIGLGVGAAGTNLFVLLATRTAPGRRPAAATLAHLMMIVGFIVTAAIAGKTLDPFSPTRLVLVAAIIAAGCFAMAAISVLGLEGDAVGATVDVVRHEVPPFRRALRQVWADTSARRFTIFIFVSMLAYGGEELMIEPFAGSVFGMTPGQSAKLSGALHGGSLGGMIAVGLIATLLRRRQIGALEGWMVAGCLASAAGLAALAMLGIAGVGALLVATVFALGLANGAFAVAAIAAMMQRVGAGAGESAGVRMGLWGAAQTIAFGGGGLAATVLSDAARHLFVWRPGAYATVFTCQAIGFLVASALAVRLKTSPRGETASRTVFAQATRS